MPTRWALHFTKEYEEWVRAGGIENNFRAHALAIGLAQPSLDDFTFIQEQVCIASRQVEQVWQHLLAANPGYSRKTPRTGLGADISYLAGEIDADFVDMLVKQNIDLVIVGLQNLDLAEQQIAMLQRQQLQVHTYVWVGNKELDTYLPEVYRLMSEFHLSTIWVDVELNNVNVRHAINRLWGHADYTVGIYTSKYMWDKFMDNTNDYCSYPLWYARYDEHPDMADFIPFGGWTVPTAKQYSSLNPRYDLNVYNVALMP